ncbi:MULTISPECIES: DUF484 family protein [Paracoccus]|jgi:uncharacterized protein YigA (DUF484 family)|uniref:DUF484 family protein n=1 Tax=Paracoccus litorisediminis TaxID=2006130 RepID=A0A844HLR1_9RHOB|nr:MULTISPECIES: DUF484 family protein [Paracoccus]MBD9526142.1 DUF484 family protein [Paracoccus sp. PAR01]MTH58592.1 DUF484 family protein [Paracoccus litorisediminis]
MSKDQAVDLPEDLRARLLARPELILSDRDLMRALIGAREADFGDNVVDIRGRAMEALETRLDRLETAHESVISAAYDNQSGMNTIHRAVLSLLEPMDFEAFLENLESSVAPILRVETLRLIMESGTAAPPRDVAGPLGIVPTGTVADLISGGRRAPRGDDIILRRAAEQTLPHHGTSRAPIRSEALLPIDLGPGRFPALLLMGSADLSRFNPAHGTDLLRFFGQAFRLVLISWLRE